MSSTTLAMTIFAVQQSLFGLLWVVAGAAGMSRRAALHWSPATVAVAAGMILIVLRGHLPVWAGWWLANVCLIGGIVLVRRGIEHFAGSRPADTEHLIAVLGTTVLTGLTIYSGATWAAVSSVSLLTGAVLLRTAYFVVKDLSDRTGRTVSLSCAAPFALLGGLLVLRGILAILYPDRFGQALSSSTGLNVGVVLSLVVCGMLINFSLAGLVVARVVTELRHYSDHDPLTGLLNRRGIEPRLEAERQRLARHGRVFSVLSLDLDHFKRVNDLHGHPVGDAVLRAFGGQLQLAGRGSDLAARVGGEEFWIVLPDTDLKGALPLAERILSDVRGLHLPGEAIQMTVSIGVATATDRAESAEALMRRLDDALYQAKSKGRDRIEVASNA